MSKLTYVAVTAPVGDTTATYVLQVPEEHAGSRESAVTHGTTCAICCNGVWEVAGLAVVRDQRYLDILNATPVIA